MVPLESAAPITFTRGQIITTQSLDREDIETYQLVLMAEDTSTSPLSASIPAIITVLDRNDNAPMFARPSYSFMLLENINNTLIMEFNVRTKS